MTVDEHNDEASSTITMQIMTILEVSLSGRCHKMKAAARTSAFSVFFSERSAHEHDWQAALITTTKRT
jgi:hypothetical protein